MWMIKCIYFMLPCYFANMAPPIAKRLGILKFLDKPVDFNFKIKNQPILGKHKTLRGFIVGIIVAICVCIFQKYLFRFDFFFKISLLNYDKVNAFLFGLLMGFGSLFGDSVGSFIKRRFKKPEGRSFIFLDQLCFVMGALLFSSFIYLPNTEHIIFILVVTFFLHILVNHIGYWLKIQENKW